MGVVTEFSPSGADLRPDLGTTFGDARLGDPVTHSTPLELSEKTARLHEVRLATEMIIFLQLILRVV